jgi:two-component system response regulator FixJ
MMFSKVTLIDQDHRRKANISMRMSEVGIFCDPYADVSEFIESGSSSGCIFLADDGPCTSAQIIKKLQENGREDLIIAFSNAIDLGRITDAMLAGAIDFVTWPFKGLEVMDRLQARATAIGNAQHRRRLAILAKEKLRVLTLREDEVIAGLAEGLTNKGIAELIGISPRTVEIHRANAMNKLNLDHSAKAIRLKLESDLF